MRRVVQRPEVLHFNIKKKKASSIKQADLRYMFKKTLYMSICQMLFYLLTPCLIRVFSYEDSTKHTQEDPDDHEPEDWIFEWNTPLISFTAQMQEQ